MEKRVYALNRGRADLILPASNLGSGRFSSHLLNAIDRCLALYPEERVSSCEELAELLRKEGIVSEGSKFRRRNNPSALDITKSELDDHEQIVDMEMPKRASNAPERDAQDSFGALVFTLGSHEDDVIRIQGTSTEIALDPDDSECEDWWYGDSHVGIDVTSRCVKGWRNEDGNLQVRLVPGDNTTNAATFKMGSHEDDVLRLQGTPTKIGTYPDSECEDWWYGNSCVEIDVISRCVKGWENEDGNLQVRLVGFQY